jgi:hypothetical protein
MSGLEIATSVGILLAMLAIVPLALFGIMWVCEKTGKGPLSAERIAKRIIAEQEAINQKITKT